MEVASEERGVTGQRSRPLWMWRHKVEELLSEPGRGLIVNDAQMVFDPHTVWIDRRACHGMLIAVPRSVLPRWGAGSLCASIHQTSHQRQPASQQRQFLCARHAAKHLREELAHETGGCPGCAHAGLKRFCPAFQGRSSPDNQPTTTNQQPRVAPIPRQPTNQPPHRSTNSQHLPRGPQTLSRIIASSWRMSTGST